MFKTKKILLGVCCALYSCFAFSQISEIVILDSDEIKNAQRLRGAIRSASGGDIIRLKLQDNNVLYNEILLTSPIIVNKNITIESFNPSKKVRLNGQNRTRILEVPGGHKVQLKNLQFFNGKGSNYKRSVQSTGGAILNQGTLTITGCKFENSKATRGAAIGSYHAKLYLKSGNKFSGNKSDWGSALYAHFGEVVVLDGKPSDEKAGGTIAIGVQRNKTKKLTYHTKYKGSGKYFNGVSFVGGIEVTSSADSGRGSLRYAIDNAFENEIIKFKGVSTVNLKKSLNIRKSVTIVGSVTLDGNNQSRIFNINNGTSKVITTTLYKVNIKNGWTSGKGGGIYNKERLQIIGGQIMNCHSDNDGGAIYNDTSGSLVLLATGWSSEIKYNSAVNQGGAIYNKGKLWSGETYTANSGNDPMLLRISTFFPITTSTKRPTSEKAIFAGSGILYNVASEGGGIYAESSANLGAGISSTRQGLIGTAANSKFFRMGDTLWNGIGGYIRSNQASVYNNGPDNLFIKGTSRNRSNASHFIPVGVWTDVEKPFDFFPLRYHGCNWVRKNSKLNSGDDPCDSRYQLNPNTDYNKYFGGLSVKDRSDSKEFYYQQNALTNFNTYTRRYSGTQVILLSNNAFMIKQKNGKARFFVRKAFNTDGINNGITGNYRNENSSRDLLKMEYEDFNFYITFSGSKTPALKLNSFTGLFTNPVSKTTYLFLHNKVYIRVNGQKLIRTYKKI